MRATTTTCWGLAVGLTFLLSDSPHPRAAGDQQAAPEAAKPLWQRDLDPARPATVVSGTTSLLLLSDPTTLESLASDDGRVLWTRSVAPESQLVAAGGRAFVISAGSVEAIGDAGQTLWEQQLPAEQALAGWGAGLLAVSAGSELFVMDDEGWRRGPIPLGTALVLPPLVTRDFVVVARADGALAALERATGKVAWTAPSPSRPLGLAAFDDRLYVTAADGTLTCRLARNGQAEWTFSLYAPAAGPPRVDDRHVYVALYDNTAQAIDRVSGARRWRQEVAGRPHGAWLAGDLLVVAQADGALMLLSSGDGARRARIVVRPDEATHLEGAGIVSGATPRIFTVTTGSSSVRRLSLWQPSP